MASNEVKVKYTVDDKGTLKRTRKAAEEAARSTENLSDSTRKYNRAQRAAAGFTNNSTREFAKMRSGTTGLVSAYAILASNVFAASAAFNALRRAAQLEQLQKGLVAVGSAAGQNLPEVAKGLRRITGEAISAEQAMRSTALASASGFRSDQINDLAKVAKGASIALGRDMGDALDRLVRGTAKVEPEILDELGIFVRLDDAVQEYADRLGVAATSLSQFERSQAFLNATIESGLSKYEDLSNVVDPNPYDKLASSLSNLQNELLGGLNSLFRFGEMAEFASNNLLSLAAVGTTIVQSVTGSLAPGFVNLAGQAAESADELVGLRISLAETVTEGSQLPPVFAGLIEQMKDGTATSEDFVNAEQSLRGSIRGTNTAIKTNERLFKEGKRSVEEYTEKLKEYEQRNVSLGQRLENLTELQQAQSNSNIATAQSASLNHAQNLRLGAAFRSLGEAVNEQRQANLQSNATLSRSQKALQGLKIGAMQAAGALRILGTAFLTALPYIGLIISAVSILYGIIKDKFFPEDIVKKRIEEAAESFESFYDIQASFENSTAEGGTRLANSYIAYAGILDQIIGKMKELKQLTLEENAKSVVAAQRAQRAAENRVVSLQKDSVEIPKRMQKLFDEGRYSEAKKMEQSLFFMTSKINSAQDAVLEANDQLIAAEEERNKNLSLSAAGVLESAISNLNIQKKIAEAAPDSNPFNISLIEQDIQKLKALESSIGESITLSAYEDIIVQLELLNRYPSEIRNSFKQITGSVTDFNSIITKNQQKVKELFQDEEEAVRSILSNFDVITEQLNAFDKIPTPDFSAFEKLSNTDINIPLRIQEPREIPDISSNFPKELDIPLSVTASELPNIYDNYISDINIPLSVTASELPNVYDNYMSDINIPLSVTASDLPNIYDNYISDINIPLSVTASELPNIYDNYISDINIPLSVTASELPNIYDNYISDINIPLSVIPELPNVYDNYMSDINIPLSVTASDLPNIYDNYISDINIPLSVTENTLFSIEGLYPSIIDIEVNTKQGTLFNLDNTFPTQINIPINLLEPLDIPDLSSIIPEEITTAISVNTSSLEEEWYGVISSLKVPSIEVPEAVIPFKNIEQQKADAEKLFKQLEEELKGIKIDEEQFGTGRAALVNFANWIVNTREEIKTLTESLGANKEEFKQLEQAAKGVRGVQVLLGNQKNNLIDQEVLLLNKTISANAIAAKQSEEEYLRTSDGIKLQTQLNTLEASRVNIAIAGKQVALDSLATEQERFALSEERFKNAQRIIDIENQLSGGRATPAETFQSSFNLAKAAAASAEKQVEFTRERLKLELEMLELTFMEDKVLSEQEKEVLRLMQEQQQVAIATSEARARGANLSVLELATKKLEIPVDNQLAQTLQGLNDSLDEAQAIADNLQKELQAPRSVQLIAEEQDLEFLGTSRTEKEQERLEEIRATRAQMEASSQRATENIYTIEQINAKKVESIRVDMREQELELSKAIMENDLKALTMEKQLSGGRITPAEQYQLTLARADVAIQSAKTELEIAKDRLEIEYRLLEIQFMQDDKIDAREQRVLDLLKEQQQTAIAISEERLRGAELARQDAVTGASEGSPIDFSPNGARMQGASGEFLKAVQAGNESLEAELLRLGTLEKEKEKSQIAYSAAQKNLWENNTPENREILSTALDEMQLAEQTAAGAQERVRQAGVSMISGMLEASAKAFAELGPEGQIAAAFAGFSSNLLMNLETFAAAGENTADRIAAGFAMAASAIQGIASIMSAQNQAAIAEIDRQIEAEKKRDGQSAESVNKINSLEAKKDKAKRKAFEQDKKMKMAQVAMNVAASIAANVAAASSAAAAGGPAAPAIFAGTLGVLNGVTLALGAAQMALIASTSYQGGGSIGGASAGPSKISVGARDNTVDLARANNASGELAYARGESGVGSGMTNYTPTPAFSGMKYRANGGNTAFMVGEQGPELFMPDRPGTIMPSDETEQMTSAPINVNFSIQALDSQSVQDMLLVQRANIIGMIREAANGSGEAFLESVNIDADQYQMVER